MMKSDLLSYLSNYSDKSLHEVPFNEVDALLFATLSYPKYQDIIKDNEICDANKILELIKEYDQSSLTDRKKLNITLLEKVCSSIRFNSIKITHYRHSINKELSEQFQAVSFVFDEFVIVSYCGTDNTVIGLKEDLNMSYLTFTPSEIDAIKYIKDIETLYKDKRLILVGHSKGGRLAVSSAKAIENKEILRDVYTFDSPNYSSGFYDKEYKKIEKKIHNYVPEDSIVGRLINEPKNPIIVKSHNSLIRQHDISSWIIKDNHLIISESGFSKQSSKISKTLNLNLKKYDDGTKKEFADTLFGFIDRLEIHEFKGKEENISLLKVAIKRIPEEWKKTPKNDRKLLRNILLKTIQNYFLNKEN